MGNLIKKNPISSIHSFVRNVGPPLKRSPCGLTGLPHLNETTFLNFIKLLRITFLQKSNKGASSMGNDSESGLADGPNIKTSGSLRGVSRKLMVRKK